MEEEELCKKKIETFSPFHLKPKNNQFSTVSNKCWQPGASIIFEIAV